MSEQPRDNLPANEETVGTLEAIAIVILFLTFSYLVTFIFRRPFKKGEDEDPVEDAMEKGDGFQGDMDLTPEEAEIIINGTENDSISMRSVLKEKHWPRVGSNVKIPYVISGKYSEKERANIARAFEDFENNTCLR